MLALPTLLISVDVSILHLAVPHIAADLNATTTETLWIIDSYGFLLAAFLVTMGVLGDRIGRRKLLFIGGACFGLASMAAAFAPTAEALIAARALLGVSAATLMPSTLSLIMSMFHDELERGKAVAIWVTMFSGGIALGPVVGGFLLTKFWWGSVFLLALPVVAILLIAGPRLLPEYKNDQAARLDLTSVVLFVAGIISFVYGVKSIDAGGVTIPQVAAFAIAAVSAVAFVSRQRRSAEPMLDLSLLRNRTIAGCLAVMMLAMVVAGGTYLYVTQYLQLVGDRSAFTAGLWLLPAAGLLTITAGAAPGLAQRYRPAAVIAGGLTISLLGSVILAISGGAAGSITGVVIGFTLAYGGGGPIIALGTDLVMGSAPPENAGAASSLSETSTELGMALGVAVLGSIGAFAYRAGLPSDLGPSKAVAESGLANLMAAESNSSPLVESAQAAFTDGLNVVAAIGVGLTLLLIATVLALVKTPPLGAAEQSEPEGSQPEVAQQVPA